MRDWKFAMPPKMPPTMKMTARTPSTRMVIRAGVMVQGESGGVGWFGIVDVPSS